MEGGGGGETRVRVTWSGKLSLGNGPFSLGMYY